MRRSDSTTKRVLVLGGTGHIGAAIARRFVADGVTVSATGLRDIARPNLDGSDVRLLTGDDRVPGVAERWIADADLVVDAATPYPVWLHGGSKADTIPQAVARARRLVTAAQSCHASFILISSFTTLPRPRDVLGQVGQGILHGLHSYFELKQQVEREVLSALGRGVKGCVVNPTACLGPYDMKAPGQTFIPQLLSGQVRGLMRQDINVVDVRDIADVVFAADAANFPHRQVPIFGHNLTVAELAQQICDQENAKPPLVQVPPVLGLAALYWAETALALAGRQTPWPSLTAMLVAAGYKAPQSAAQVALAPNLRPLETTIRDAIAWYKDIGRL
ncbi:MAG: NAD-dependent epimerase/dehydratase family protein [Pseudomonadota bacterium]